MTLKEKLVASLIDDLERKAEIIIRDNSRDLREALECLERAMALLQNNRRDYESV